MLFFMQSKKFSESLRNFRYQHGLSQTECAALIVCLSTRMIQKWEQGISEPPLWAQGLLLNALDNARSSE